MDLSRFNPFAVTTFYVCDAGCDVDMAIIERGQDLALARQGCHPGISVRRYRSERGYLPMWVAEADIPNWRVWCARLAFRWRFSRLRLSLLGLKAHFTCS